MWQAHADILSVCHENDKELVRNVRRFCSNGHYIEMAQVSCDACWKDFKPTEHGKLYHYTEYAIFGTLGAIAFFGPFALFGYILWRVIGG